MSTIKNYLSLIKFSHTIFAMPFAMIGFFLGLFGDRIMLIPFRGNRDYSASSGGLPYDLKGFILPKLILVVFCMIFARSAAMAFNRWLDKSFDAKNPRTALREIPSGIIGANGALRFSILSSVAFIFCTWYINKLCFILSPVALIVVLGYSYTKRFTPLCHLILGLGLSLAPIGAYIAVTGHFALLPMLFSFAVVFWVSGFDIIYALQDEEFDKANQLYSIPAALGKATALRVSAFLHIVSAACVVFAGAYGGFHWSYWMGVTVFIGMLVYQHSIVTPTDLSRVNLAFMTTNGIASVVFAIFVIADLFIHF